MATCSGIPPRYFSAGTNSTPPMPTPPMRAPTTNTTSVKTRRIKLLIATRLSGCEICRSGPGDDNSTSRVLQVCFRTAIQPEEVRPGPPGGRSKAARNGPESGADVRSAALGYAMRRREDLEPTQVPRDRPGDTIPCCGESLFCSIVQFESILVDL